MSSIALAFYEIVIYKKNGSTRNTENISDFNNGKDLLTLFQKLPEYLDNSTAKISVIDLKSDQRRVRINGKEFKPFGRVISGEIETGYYGTENPIIDHTGTTIETKKKNHSTMSPFYFLCDLEQNKNSAILILQRFRQFGIYSILSQLIKKEFEKQNPDYTIRISPLVSKKALDAVIKHGIIKKISFQSTETTKIAHNINSKNPTDQFDPNDVYVEYNVIARPRKSVSLMNSISRILGRDVKVSDYISVREFEYNKVKVHFDLNGKPQTIDVSNWARFSPDIDITDKVGYNASGFPNTEDIESEALSLLNDIKQEQK